MEVRTGVTGPKTNNKVWSYADVVNIPMTSVEGFEWDYFYFGSNGNSGHVQSG